MSFAKNLYKREFAEKLGFSLKTLARLINMESFEEMKKLGYFKRQKMLNPRQMVFICDKYGYEF